MAARDDDLLKQLISSAKAAPAQVAAPTRPERPRPTGASFGIAAGKIATWAVTATFGGGIWAINGGYSVAGLELVAGLFNAWGQVFWRAMALWQITLLDTPVPVLPWVLVWGTTMLQIVALLGHLRHWRLPAWLYLAAVVVSAYDLITTHAGLLSEEWLLGVPWPLVLLLATAITFTFEAIMSLLLRN